jgi:hypothetical protein
MGRPRATPPRSYPGHPPWHLAQCTAYSILLLAAGSGANDRYKKGVRKGGDYDNPDYLITEGHGSL